MATKAGPFAVAKRRNSAELRVAAASKKAGMQKMTSLQLLTRTVVGRKSMPMYESKAKTMNLYAVAEDAGEVPTIAVRYRSCVYTLRPRPEAYYTLVDCLQLIVLFEGDPVMTYIDPQDKLRYVTDPYEMSRAYRDFPNLLTVDLRFD